MHQKSKKKNRLKRPQEDFIPVTGYSDYISRIKEFHRGKYAVNEKYYGLQEIGTEEAFARIKEVHLRYWKNEDRYHHPNLSWPFRYDEGHTSNWQVLTMKSENRFFVAFSADLGHSTDHAAYEIDVNTKGDKFIINATY